MKDSKIWFNGEIMNYSDVSVPLLTHSLQYGSGIFEGIRAYDADGTPVIFRLREHVDRFILSAKIYRMGLKYGTEELSRAIAGVVKANGFESCYIRPFAYFSDDSVSLSTIGKPVSVAIVAVPFGQYFGEKVEKGIRCKVSSWRRINSDILPIQAKASGNYLNSVAAMGEVQSAGYDEAILLTMNGYLAEGPGENLFVVRNNRIITPGLESDILFGITRFSLIQVAKDMGFDIEERQIHRDELHTCDEAFFCGTAAEVTPIVEVDGIPVGNGKPGEITGRIGNRFREIVTGKVPEYSHWLTYVK